MITIPGQPNGANLTGGGIGAAFTSDVSTEPTYVPFNGAARVFSPGLSAALILGPIGRNYHGRCSCDGPSMNKYAIRSYSCDLTCFLGNCFLVLPGRMGVLLGRYWT